MKKINFIFPAVLLLVASCSNPSTSSGVSSSNSSSLISSSTINEKPSTSSTTISSSSSSSVELDFMQKLSDEERANLSVQGYASLIKSDFAQYVGTDAYKVVTTEDEFIDALNNARYDYETIWDENTNSYTQNLIKEGTVHVIEIANDLNLGYYKLSNEAKAKTQIVSDYANKYNNLKDYLYFSDMFLENGMSQIKIERTSNLMIYSKTGAKITHAGFKLTSCDNIVFRNIFFDELWQWEDGISKDASKIGDYDWFGWSYFKIGFSGYIWIDHCKFGKSYDGQIDYANANYHSTKGTSFRAPYGATSKKGLSITWCDFAAGSDDKDGYLYKMMDKLEEEYQSGTITALYYKALRDKGISFDDILYGLAIPQKKGFLIGDDQDYKEDNHVEYDYNLELNVTFANVIFTNLEDRLPKVRGGNVYLHNCIADSTEYYKYRTRLSSAGASNAVKAVNSSWKCALVSQGIVCGQGGSVKAENCMFLGIKYLLKNNDSGSPAPYSYGGFELVNCKYVCDSTNYVGSSDDENHKFSNSNKVSLAPKYFVWHTENGLAPYAPSLLIELDRLEIVLENENYGVGPREKMNDYMMLFNY